MSEDARSKELAAYARESTQAVDFRNDAVDLSHRRPDLRRSNQSSGPFRFHDQPVSAGAANEAIINNADHYQFDPDINEKIIEIPKIVEQIVEKEVVIPEVHIVEVIKEIPQIQEVVREVPRYEFQEVVKEVPKIEVKYIEKQVEVPQIMIRDVPMEVPEVQEVTRTIPRVLIKEIPVERVRKVTKTVYNDVEEIEYIPIPYIIQTERVQELPTYKTEVHTVENVNQITKPKLVPVEKEVAEYVPQYIDIAVDEYGLPLKPAPSLDILLRGVEVAG